MTRQVVSALRPLNIKVHDHLIAGRDGVASLSGLGLM
jgi:DNA repair protein RadC